MDEIKDKIDKMCELNKEYVEANDFSKRREAYDIWSKMTPDERQQMCLQCSKSRQTKKGNLLRPKSPCYHCEAGILFTRKVI